ncbi:MAG TPA: acyclic terpene utilization AtuA family protein, partial [Pyrinomonadaceae bacterium]
TGGIVNIPSIKEQLLYEMGDPKSYITPDVVADFTSINLKDDGKNRVRVHGIKGNPNTDFYKVSIAYSAGWKAVGTLVYAYPDAYAKAQAADKILRARLEKLGLKFDVILTEFVGVNATHGHLAGEPPTDIPEVQLRFGVRGQNKADVERFTKELAPLILTGPPAVTGFAGGRPKVEEIMAYFPALIPKTLIETKVEVITA